MNKFMEQAKLIKEDMISYRRTLHSNPEVGPKLPKTKAYVMDQLSLIHISVVSILKSYCLYISSTADLSKSSSLATISIVSS